MATPATIGPYAVRRELGRGGMGVVLEAEGPRGRVAIKLLHATSGGPASDRALARFERERRLLAQLGPDQGFVPILDAGTSPSGPYLVLAFVPGGTLRARLRHGAMDLPDVVELGRALARALAAAHALGIVHRDLKPENVLFEADGRPLIADLGLAKHFREDVKGASVSVSLTGHGEFAGTVGYAAPEQLEDAHAAGPAADVFAVGTILYECLAGANPFAADSPTEVVGKILAADVEPLAKLRPGCPATLAGVIGRALARDPARRYPDARALLRALEDPALLARRRRWPVVLVVAFAALAGGGALALRPSPAPAPAARPADDLERLLAKARERLDAHDSPAAVALATRAIELSPQDGRAFVIRGRARARKRDLAGAIEDATRAIDRAADLADAWNLRGAARQYSGDREGALADLDRALALAPRDGAIHRSRAALLSDLGRLDDARRSADRACELEPAEPRAWTTRAGIRTKQGDREGARADLDEAVRVGPDHPPAWGDRGVLRTKLRDPGALEDLERALALDPEQSRYRFARAQVRLATGATAEARADLDEVLRLEPENMAARGLRADLLGREGRYADAVADLTAMLEQRPDDAKLFTHRGVWRLSMDDLDGAEADLARALALDSKQPLAWITSVELRRRRHDDAGALAALEQAIPLARDPEERRLLEVQERELRAKLGR